MCKGAKNVFARVLLIIPETAVNEMIRPEFFERKDLTAAQKCFLEFLRAFAFTLESAAAAFDNDLPAAALQSARRADVIDELAESAAANAVVKRGPETKQFFKALVLARRAAAVLRTLCTAGASQFEGLEESRVFLGSLCRCAADRLDWSHKRQLLGSRYQGAAEDDLEITFSELPASMAAERRVERAQALIDFHDALIAARGMFDVVREIDSFSSELFPVEDEKYWRKG